MDGCKNNTSCPSSLGNKMCQYTVFNDYLKNNK